MRFIVALAALVSLGACTTTSTAPRPVSVGSGANSLKRTPCACVLKDQKPGLPAYLVNADASMAA